MGMQSQVQTKATAVVKSARIGREELRVCEKIDYAVCNILKNKVTKIQRGDFSHTLSETHQGAAAMSQWGQIDISSLTRMRQKNDCIRRVSQRKLVNSTHS